MIIIQRPGESNNDGALDFFKPGRWASRTYNSANINSTALIKDAIFANKPCTIIIANHYAAGYSIYMRMCWIAVSSSSTSRAINMLDTVGTVTPLMSFSIKDFQTPYSIKLSNLADFDNDKLYGIYFSSGRYIDSNFKDVNAIAQLVAYPDDGNTLDFEVRYVQATQDTLDIGDFNALKSMYSNMTP